MNLDSTIQRLPDNVINQIKAGEVIERPFNVVKELLENSLDASATAIKVELLDGGKRLIQISDNGRGIERSQVPLAIERHTTSKLQVFEDLESIHSFGFRGEALASIASISKFSIKTKTQHEEMGLETVFENGCIVSTCDVMMSTGTSITIKDIFQNVPARLKFLRSTATEFSHIHEFLNAMSLAHPKVSFCFVHNGRTVFDYKSKATLRERFAEVHPASFEHYATLNFTHGSLSISGFAILPEKIDSPHNSLTVFVNGRFVTDRLIRSGIYDGYRGLLMKNVTPSVVLFLQLDSKTIDVNVHPAKTEIRFYDPLFVQDCVSRSIEEALKEKLNAGFCVTMPQTSMNNFNFTQQREIAANNIQKNSIQYLKSVQNVNASEEKIPLSSFGLTAVSSRGLTAGSSSLFIENKNRIVFSNSKFLGQYAQCYLLFQNKEELLFVDQHAFHERILFEEVSTFYKENKILKQLLLNPKILKADHFSSAIYNEYSQFIQSVGFEIEILKDEHIAIHSFPTFLNERYLEETFFELSKKLCQQNNIDASLLYHDCFATIACHSAIRSGESMSEDFVQKLMNRTSDVDFFAHCPHGRPVIRKFSQNDVARWFERV